MFLCLDRAVALLAGDERVELAPNDVLVVSPGTPHAYQFLRPYTRMIGWLVPGLFESFFLLGEPCSATVYPGLDELDIPLGSPPATGA